MCVCICLSFFLPIIFQAASRFSLNWIERHKSEINLAPARFRRISSLKKVEGEERDRSLWKFTPEDTKDMRYSTELCLILSWPECQ